MSRPGASLLNVATLADYTQIKTRLLVLGGVIPAIGNWIKWWDARHYYLLPVFRGYSISSVNMAEIGHASLKRKKPLYLVDAAWEDVSSTVLQEEEIQKFLEGKGVSSGKGSSTTSNAHKREK